MTPLLVHPLACRCEACKRRNPAGYVHNASDEDMRRHLELIEAEERKQGIRPLPAMPAGDDVERAFAKEGRHVHG